jgi:hypothetical protein
MHDHLSQTLPLQAIMGHHQTLSFTPPTHLSPLAELQQAVKCTLCPIQLEEGEEPIQYWAKPSRPSLLAITLSFDPQSQQPTSIAQNSVPTHQRLELDRSQLCLFSHAPRHQQDLEIEPATALAPSSMPASPLCTTVKYRGKAYL